MNKMRIFVDADSCPCDVRDYILEKALRLNVNVIYAANKVIPFSRKSSLFAMQLCPEGKDSADLWILNAACESDIVVTRDIPFAKRLVEKNITAINDRGTLFSKENVEYLLKERDLSMQMAALGLHKGVKFGSYGKKEFSAFVKCFNEVLEKKLN